MAASGADCTNPVFPASGAVVASRALVSGIAAAVWLPSGAFGWVQADRAAVANVAETKAAQVTVIDRMVRLPKDCVTAETPKSAPRCSRLRLANRFKAGHEASWTA